MINDEEGLHYDIDHDDLHGGEGDDHDQSEGGHGGG